MSASLNFNNRLTLSFHFVLFFILVGVEMSVEFQRNNKRCGFISLRLCLIPVLDLINGDFESLVADS